MQSNKNQEIRENDQHQYSSHLMIAALMISWFSKQSMVILLGNGVVYQEFRVIKSKTIRCHKE